MRGKPGPNVIRTLIVVGAFAALLAYVLLVETRKEAPPPEEATPTPPTIVDLDVAQVEGVYVSDGDRTVRLVRRGEEWEIVEATSADALGPADTAAITWTVDGIAHLQARLKVLDEVPDPATYGLDAASLVVTLELTSGAQEQIRVGRETPDGTALYVQREGDPALYIVSRYVMDSFFEWLTTPPLQPTPTPADRS